MTPRFPEDFHPPQYIYYWRGERAEYVSPAEEEPGFFRYRLCEGHRAGEVIYVALRYLLAYAPWDQWTVKDHAEGRAEL